MALRVHSGRRIEIDPARLVPPDSYIARDADVAARDHLTPALLNHSRRLTHGARRSPNFMASRTTVSSCTWLQCSTTQGSRALCPRLTSRFAVPRWHASSDSHGVPADGREIVANAIAMHHTPGVGVEAGAEPFLLSAGAAVDVFGLRSNEVPDAVRDSVIREYPRLGFKREFAGHVRAEAKRVPRGRMRVPLRGERCDDPARALPRLGPSLSPSRTTKARFPSASQGVGKGI